MPAKQECFTGADQQRGFVITGEVVWGAGGGSQVAPHPFRITSHDHATHGAAAFVRFLIFAVVEFPQGGVPANFSVVAAFASTLSHSTVIHTLLLWHFPGAVCCFSGVCACQAGGLLLLVAVHFCPFLLGGVCMGRGALVLLGCFVRHVRALWRHCGVDINELGGAYVRYGQRGERYTLFSRLFTFWGLTAWLLMNPVEPLSDPIRGGEVHPVCSVSLLLPCHSYTSTPWSLTVAGCWLTYMHACITARVLAPLF
jgi:hypothetical protein